MRSMVDISRLPVKRLITFQNRGPLQLGIDPAFEEAARNGAPCDHCACFRPHAGSLKIPTRLRPMRIEDDPAICNAREALSEEN